MTNAINIKIIHQIALCNDFHLLQIQLLESPHLIIPGNLLYIDEYCLPIMRQTPERDVIEVLIKGALPEWLKPFRTVKGYITETGFNIDPDNNFSLLIGQGVGIAPITFMAQMLRREIDHKQVALLGFKTPPPFRTAPSRILMPELPGNLIATMPLMEDWKIPCRIAIKEELPGCFHGDLIELCDYWLKQHSGSTPTIYACVDTEMGGVIADLAHKNALTYNTILLT